MFACCVDVVAKPYSGFKSFTFHPVCRTQNRRESAVAAYVCFSGIFYLFIYLFCKSSCCGAGVQICKEFCSWVADHSQGAEPCATDITNGEQQPQFTRTSSLFEQQVSSLTSCEDVAQMMVLAAQQLLSGNASDTTKRRAKALICILSERFS